MDDHVAILALAALGQSTRFRVLQLLLENQPEGLAASQISALIGTPKNTMTNHLNVLTRAALVTSERHGQQIVYRANVEEFGSLVSLLQKALDVPHRKDHT